MHVLQRGLALLGVAILEAHEKLHRAGNAALSGIGGIGFVPTAAGLRHVERTPKVDLAEVEFLADGEGVGPAQNAEVQTAPVGLVGGVESIPIFR